MRSVALLSRIKQACRIQGSRSPNAVVPTESQYTTNTFRTMFNCVAQHSASFFSTFTTHRTLPVSVSSSTPNEEEPVREPPLRLRSSRPLVPVGWCGLRRLLLGVFLWKPLIDTSP